MLRERRMGVPVRAYILSKLGVLAVIGALQCLALVGLASRGVTFAANPVLAFLALWSTTLCGTALGLLISAVVTSQNSALALVPIALIPQLIFSKRVIGQGNELGGRIQDAMISSWGSELLEQLRKGSVWPCVKAELVLLGLTVLLLILSAAAVAAQDEGT